MNNRFEIRNEVANEHSAVGRGIPHVLDLDVHVPDTTRGVVGVDLTHVIHTE